MLLDRSDNRIYIAGSEPCFVCPPDRLDCEHREHHVYVIEADDGPR